MAASASLPAHPPQVAGLFYPSERQALCNALDRACLAAPATALQAKMAVAPHAGLAYCGIVGAAAARALENGAPLKRVVVLGPNHRWPLEGVAVHPAPVWATPLGAMKVDHEAIAKILPLEGVRVDAAPFRGEHSLEIPLLALQRRNPDIEIAPALVGSAAPELVEEILSRLWGGAETAIVISSDLSHFLPREMARAKDAETRALIEAGRYEAIDPSRACGAFALRGALRRAGALGLRATGFSYATSDDAGGPSDRVVGYGAFAFEYPGVARLGDTDRRTLLWLASAALDFAARSNGLTPEIMATPALAPALMARRACFVTLKRSRALRGCVGSTVAERPLAGDVGVNAVKAGFRDPRFAPLSSDELEGLEIRIAILSPCVGMAVRSEEELVARLRPDRDGLILRSGAAAGLFLPSVWRELPDPKAFVKALKAKIGWAADHWPDGLEAARFDAESFGAPFLRPNGAASEGLLLRAAS